MERVAGAIDDAERRIRQAVPEARLIYLEPDLDRPVAPAAGRRRTRTRPSSSRRLTVTSADGSAQPRRRPVGSSAVRTSSMITRTADLLDNPVRPNAWGSATEIPRLLGLEPTGRPQAELWMGAHPAAPSRLRSGGTLAERIEDDPTGELSPRGHAALRGAAAVPDEDHRGGAAAVAAGAPEPAAGPRRVRRGAATRRPDRLARAQLRRSQPQAGAGLRADAVRGAVRVPAHPRTRCGC